ncbi:MAG TPA: glycosyltransferase family 2 protein [Flavobacteriales bacterium]|nr:glycosyltransferase family 2 protein [Flavobacteriales bacterium]
MDPKISVVMPLYNKRPYVKEAIESVLNQSFGDFELIVVDDGSTDGSQDVIKTVNDKRLFFFQNEKNLGTAGNANKCIDLSKGKYIARLDADDLMTPGRLFQQLQLMEKNSDIGISSGAVEIFGAKKEIWSMPLTHDELAANILFKPPIAQGASMIRKEMLIKNNLRYDENSLNVAEDWLMWFKCFKVTKFANVPEVLILYRQYDGNITNNANHNFYQSRKFVYDHMFKDLGLPIEKTDIHFFTKPYFSSPVTARQVHEYCEWLTFLKNWNHSKKVFHEKFFDKSIEDLRERFFYFLPAFGTKPTMAWLKINGYNVSKINYYIKHKVKSVLKKRTN